MLDVPAKALFGNLGPNAHGNTRETMSNGAADLPRFTRMKNSRLKRILQDACGTMCSRKASEHTERMVGSTSGHAGANNLGIGPALLDSSKRKGQIGRIFIGVVTLDLERGALEARLRLLDKGKPALPHRIGIAAEQIA